MSERTKAGISYALSALAYAVLAVDEFTAVDMSSAYGIGAVIVGAVATAFGIFWTNPRE